MFFFHVGADNLVPIRSPRRMAERLKEAGVPVEFYEVPNAGHMAAVVDGGALRHSVAFADRYLKGGSSLRAGASSPPRTGAASSPTTGAEDGPARSP
jgi:acetyl esterase/lipase